MLKKKTKKKKCLKPSNREGGRYGRLLEMPVEAQSTLSFYVLFQ